jgi:hypothetical protein
VGNAPAKIVKALKSMNPEAAEAFINLYLSNEIP